MKFLIFASLLTFDLVLASPSHNGQRSFTVGQGVQTTSGLVLGKSAPNLTEVSEYLGIPYAKPPIANLRFAAPKPFIGHRKINATSFQPNRGFGEDCLTLNIWTKPQTGEKKKAVLLFIHGGGFQTGSTNDPQINGQYFAANQDVVIVTINYRMNVFGFTGLPGMDQNVGFLDQRLAIEWVHQNIAQFGGDPQRITISGQSAGSTSVDVYSYAWTEKPLVNGFIEQSGTVTSFFDPAPPNNLAAWYNTTAKLNCGGPSTPIPQTLTCMRTLPFQDILNATQSPGIASLLGTFSPTVDNKTVFSDYSARTANGQYIQKPYLIGNDDYEAGLFKLIASSADVSLTNRRWAIFNLAFFSCPNEAAALSRASHVPTYRFRYYGEFPNTRLSSNPSSGAWHGSEIPVVWQTTQDATDMAPTPAEAMIGANLNAAWAAFAKNPTTALSQAPFLWPKYDESKGSLIRLGYNNQTSASFVAPGVYDQSCDIVRGIFRGAEGSFGSAIFGDESVFAPLDRFANLTEMGGGSEVGY